MRKCGDVHIERGCIQRSASYHIGGNCTPKIGVNWNSNNVAVDFDEWCHDEASGDILFRDCVTLYLSREQAMAVLRGLRRLLPAEEEGE